jgi:hypothetical protein
MGGCSPQRRSTGIVATDEHVGKAWKTYGKPIAHWMQVLEKAAPLKHMELVGHLKAEHQLRHGHANALVAWFLAKK